jgi:hypothetical protein
MWKLSLAGVAFALGIVLAACSPRLTWQAMADQPVYRAYDGSQVLTQGQAAQLPPEGSLPRGHLQDDALLFTGLTDDGSPSEVFPFEITRADLDTGREHYNAFCAPCHDYAGTGRGIVVERGLSPPPSFHTNDLRQAPAGHLFAVISLGQGNMPSYAEQIGVRERWGVVAYVRALQLSQNATLDDVPADQQELIAVREVAP